MENKYLGNGTFELEMTRKNIDVANVTPQQVRNIVLSGMLSSGPGLERRAMPTQNELENLLAMARDAVTNGRLIDFGHWPNEQIKQSGARAGKMYNESALGHPFSQPYIFMHTWNDPKLAHLMQERDDKASCVYLVNPYPEKGETCISFEACSMECMVIHGIKTLCIGDRLLFDASQSKGQDKFYADIIPFAYRWLPDRDMMASLARQLPEETDFVRMAASNILDPFMMGLAILNTRGVKQETVTPNAKLAKARAKAGKPAIPSFRRVDSESYVTALQQRLIATKGPSLGGHHASPVMHLRMGHWRRLNEAGTKRTFIQDTLVNATDEMRASFRMTRSHYQIKPES